MQSERQANVVVRTPAKVNLFLEILRKRPDGYHELNTFMAAVNLLDTLEFKEEATDAIILTCNVAEVPTGPQNLVWRAVELFRQHTGLRHGVRIHLTKRIPMAAGLAGGSSDAAAALVGLNRLWKVQLPSAELARLASQLGSDVPFFCTARAAWCTGRGEIIVPFRMPSVLHLVLAFPGLGLSTAEVYKRVIVPSTPVDDQEMRTALTKGDVRAVGLALHNRLQPAAEALSPEVSSLRDTFAALHPPGHCMSGSGSSYFALCNNRAEAIALANQVRLRYCPPRTESAGAQGLRVFVVRTLRVRGEKDNVQVQARS